MKTSSCFFAWIAILTSAAFLYGTELPTHPDQVSGTPVDRSITPTGLSSSDWSGIRGAYERNRHAIVANRDGTHQARNPGQGWLTSFDARGFTVTPDAGGWSWGLELEGYGEVTLVRQDGGKILYVRSDGLTEWFVNDSRGLEQGWTLAKRPEQADVSQPHCLHLAVRGSLRPQVSTDGTRVAFVNGSGDATVTYGGLEAWDADGKNVRVRFAECEAGNSGLCVVIDDEGARYPISIDPIAQQAYLKASNTGAGDYFGFSVAVFGDTVVVGAPNEDSSSSGVNGNQTDDSSTDSGAVYVFVRNGATWSQQAYLKASNTGAGDQFGSSVAISGDTIVVGARYEDSSSTGVNGNQSSNAAVDSGAAYVFVRSGTTWSQQAYLKASNAGAGDYFGNSVTVFGDTVVVGAHKEASSATGVNGNQANNSAAQSGAAYVFVRSGSAWSQQAYLKASNNGVYAPNWFGCSVAVSGDTVVVGAMWEDGGSTGVNGNQNLQTSVDSGAAYVFARSGTTWSQQAYLKASNTGADDYFGASVAISGDTVVVGAANEDSNATGVNGDLSENSATDSGAAYVFVRSGSNWSQQAYLKASNTGASDYFGVSVAVSGDRLVVGASCEASSATGVNGNQSDNSISQSGAAYVFERNGNIWSQKAYLKASNTNPYNWFSRVAISGDTMVVGAYGEGVGSTGVNGNQTDNSATAAGAAYVFVAPYSLSVSSGHGSVQGAGDHEPYSIATLSVVPDPGYVFTGWTGDATGTANPLSVLMDANKIIGATYIIGIEVLADGQVPTGSEVVQRGQLTVTMQTAFANGVILYTLDGSAPSLGSTLYTEPFTLARSCMVRAVAYSSDFSSQVQSPPLAVVIVPTLTAVTAGGGSVSVQPPDGSYSSGSMATLTATPASGWTFLQWLGDATGTNPVTNVQMTRNKCVQAVFGTTVTTTTVGSGSIWQSPVAAFYPYGTRIRFSGLPASGNYLAFWSNAVSSTNNPLDFLVTTPNPTLTAVFQPLGTGQFALTLVADGGGKVAATQTANRYSSGANVRLTAQPDLGQDFVGWSGDAAGSVNPLTVAMNQSKAITAVFTKRPGLQVGTSLEGLVEDGFRLTLTGEFGKQYEILGSADLVNWTQAGTLTNVYGTSQFTDGNATNQPQRFYRAAILNP